MGERIFTFRIKNAVGRSDTGWRSARRYVGLCCIGVCNSDTRRELLEMGHSGSMCGDMWFDVLFEWSAFPIY